MACLLMSRLCIAEADPDAIRLTFTVEGERATKAVIEFAGMQWYARCVADK